MRKVATRSITWLVLTAIFLSLLALPAMASAGNEEDTAAAAAEDGFPEGAAYPLEDDEPTLVNVIDDEPVAEPEPAEETVEPAPAEETPESDPAEESAEPPAEESVEPDVPTDEPPGETDPDAEEGEASEEMELDGAGERYTVSYYSGSTLLGEETVTSGEKPVNAPKADSSGRAIKAWLNSAGTRVVVEETAVTANVSYYAWFAPRLNSVTHDSYISGTGNAKFSPTVALTRAQAATILYNLLESRSAGPFNTAFSDVSDSAWYSTAVKTLASIGVINGYTDGTFRPNKNVTRAEFVTMLVNLTGVSGGECTFSDVSEKHWARSSIAAASANGWVNGYEDGTFRPGNNITRAEAVVIMNRVLGRSADKDVVDHGEGLFHFIDVSTGAWYYYDVMEAATGHQFARSDGVEVWTDFNQESSDLAPGLHQIGTIYVYVDGNGQPVYMKAGINCVDGKFFYAASAGYSCDGDLSSVAGYVVFANGAAQQQLKTGFNQISTTLFYWNTETASAQLLSAGLNKIGTNTYWADEAGYNIRNSFVNYSGKAVTKGGVVYLGGKNYLTDGRCAIITTGSTTDVSDYTGYAYYGPSYKPSAVDLKKHTYEYGGYMFYVKDDYSLATNEWVGLLYFNSYCVYTSGDSTLDGYVYNVVKSFLYNNALTQVQKLLKAYYYMRGGEGKYYDTTVNGVYYGKSPFGYTKVNQLIMDQRRYNRQGVITDMISAAKTMFSNGRGMCYQWAGAYLYLARRIGFQAYPVAGRLNGSSGAVHCWDMIYWDGYWHLSDVEYEWGYLSGWYGGNYKVYRNLFDQALSTEWATSYTSPESGLTYAFPSNYDRKPTVFY